MDIGDKIRRVRENRGFTQNEVAERAGMYQGTYSRLERKSDRIRFDEIQAVANALEIDVQEMLFGELALVFERQEFTDLKRRVEKLENAVFKLSEQPKPSPG